MIDDFIYLTCHNGSIIAIDPNKVEAIESGHNETFVYLTGTDTPYPVAEELPRVITSILSKRRTA